MSEPPRPTAGDRRPILRFVLVFAASLLLFQLVFLFLIVGSAPLDDYLALNARAAGRLLTWLGQDVLVQDNRLAVGASTFRVSAPCSGLQPMAMLGIAILAFPSTRRAKLLGLLVGTLTLLVLNLVRIASLCLVELHFSDSFELFHLSLWPMALILCSIALWTGWARRAVRT